MERISAASYSEAAISLGRKGYVVRRAILDRILAQFQIGIEAVTPEQAKLARQAFVLFGQGRHPAALNFGDCFSHALARSCRELLRFKGVDFIHTDISIA